MKSELKIPETVVMYDLNSHELGQAMFCDLKTLGIRLADCLDKDKNIVGALISGVEQGTLTMQDIFFMAACFYFDTIFKSAKEIKADE